MLSILHATPQDWTDGVQAKAEEVGHYALTEWVAVFLWAWNVFLLNTKPLGECITIDEDLRSFNPEGLDSCTSYRNILTQPIADMPAGSQLLMCS